MEWLSFAHHGNAHREVAAAAVCLRPGVAGRQDPSEPGARVGIVAVKSKAQRRKFAQLLVEGKIKPEVYERWNRNAGRKKLPERVKRKKK